MELAFIKNAHCWPELGTTKNFGGWGQEDKLFHFSMSSPVLALAWHSTTRDVMGFQNSATEMQMSLEVVFGGGNRIGDWAEKMVWKREVGIKQRSSTSG